MTSANPYQYADLEVRAQDPYANAKYEIILEHIPGQRSLRILNAGCGSGDLSLLLARQGHSVLGIDPDAAYIELAQRRAGGAACRFLVSSIEAFDSSERFDCVIATDVLEHIQDDEAAFRKLVSLTNPGGLIVITVPAGSWLFGYHDEQLGHFRRYSRKTLRKVIEPACQVDDVRYFGMSLIPVCLLYSRFLRRPYPVAESGDATARPLLAPVLRAVLAVEKKMRPPLGTSVILRGRPR